MLRAGRVHRRRRAPCCIQGTTLPWLVRRLGLPGPDAAEDALQAASLLTEATRAGLDRLEEVRSPDDPEEVIAQLEERARRRANMTWERLGRSHDEVEPPSVAYRRLRLEMLAAERATIVRRPRRGDRGRRGAARRHDDGRPRGVAARPAQDAQARVEGELEAPAQRTGDCEHLRAAPRVVKPRTPEGCEECLRDGTRWVHLRLCLGCGHVGCCDSSLGQHADRHFDETGHPVMRSIEPGRGLALVLRRPAPRLRIQLSRGTSACSSSRWWRTRSRMSPWRSAS